MGTVPSAETEGPKLVRLSRRQAREERGQRLQNCTVVAVGQAFWLQREHCGEQDWYYGRAGRQITRVILIAIQTMKMG